MTARFGLFGSPYSIGQTLAWPWFFVRPSVRRRSALDPAPAAIDAPPGGDTIRVVFFGDLMPMTRRGPLRVEPALRDLFSGADLVVGNCETPVAERTSTRGNRFSLDVGRLRDLLDASGIPPGRTLLSLANNHIGDLGTAGIRATIDHLERLGCTPIGLRCGDSDRPLHVVRTERGPIAFAAWTEWLNRRAPAGGPRPWRSDEILSHDGRSDGAGAPARWIGVPHWDDEFRHFPHERTRRAARRLLASGFSILVGHHPHVIQPLERHGDGICLYSCGNYLPSSVCAVPWPARLGAVLEVHLPAGSNTAAPLAYRVHATWYRASTPGARIDFFRPDRGRAERLAGRRLARLFPGAPFGLPPRSTIISPISSPERAVIGRMQRSNEGLSPRPTSGTVSVIPLSVPRPLVPEDARKRTIVDVLAEAIDSAGLALADGDILAVSSKVVALFEGGTVRLDSVVPSRRTRLLARLFSKDPRKLELMFREGPILGVVPLRYLSRHRIGRRIADGYSVDPESTRAGYDRIERFEMYTQKYGAIINEGGIDIMNSPDGFVTCLPENPSRSARAIREALERTTGRRIAVIVTDTTSPIGRLGTLDIAIGYSGLDPVERKLFVRDLFGDLRPGDANLIVDSAAAIAGAVMGQTTEMRPAALIRGLRHAPERASGGETGFEDLVYPRRLIPRAVALTILATALFRLVRFLICHRPAPHRPLVPPSAGSPPADDDRLPGE